MFRNRSFRTKLALAIAPPLVVMAALVATVVRPRIDEAREAAGKRDQAALAYADMQLRDELQIERDATIQRITSRPGTPIDLTTVRTATDAQRDALRRSIGSIGSTTAGIAGPVARIEQALRDLEVLRSQIDTGTVGPLQVFASYEALVTEHLAMSESIARSSSNTELLRRAQANLDYLRYKNAVSRANTYLAVRVESGTVTTTDLLQIGSDLALADQFRAQFLVTASPAAVAAERAATADLKVTDAVAMRDTILLAGSRNTTPKVSPAAWWSAAAVQLEAMDAVEDLAFADLVSVAAAQEDAARADSTLYLSVLGIGVLLAALTALAFARSMATRIAKVSDEAHDIASTRLPEVLDALRNPTPEVLAQALPQVQADSTDEIGSLAASFNAVLRTSVETSIAHAQRRSRTLTNILVNLGRRNQALIDRQLALVDELESTQRDPEVLRGLFQLDHMITSLRRNAENLLVLASDTQARSWSAPVPMIDVVRGAVSEVEDMSRIVLELDLADSSLIGGRYAVDLSHLVAELVDNALAFSPPSTSVQLRAERTPLHFRVWILDSGLGMSEVELASANQRVTNPPDVDELSADRIGFQVIGRLARRLGVAVRLQPNPGGGLAASVTVPAALLEPEPQLDQLLPVPPAARRAAESVDHVEARDAVAAAWASLADAPDSVFSMDTLDAIDGAEAAATAAPADDDRAAVAAPRSRLESRTPGATRPPVPNDAVPMDAVPGSRPTWLDDAPEPAAPAPRTPVAVAASAATPDLRADATIPAPAADPVTSSGLQRRVPGQAFVGEAKAQQFDSGQFRRLPMPGDRTGEGRGVTGDDVGVAERRLRALSGLQTGAGRARRGDAEDTGDQS
jgi:hypothetical protein